MREGGPEMSDNQHVDRDRRRSARLCRILLAGLEDGVAEEKVAALHAWYEGVPPVESHGDQTPAA
jgi:hypothetical protein